MDSTGQYIDHLMHLASQTKGVLSTKDVVRAGIPKSAFYAFLEINQFERIGRGIYLSPDAWLDGMYVLSLRSPQSIFSHETALYLHDLTDREPIQYSVTLPTGYNPSKLVADGITVYTVKRELLHMGMTEKVTPFGHTVRVYDMERTVCDIVRSRKKGEAQTLQDALHHYTRRSDKHIGSLLHYARIFQVEKILNTYLEVLL
ncbi:MAG: type IV toxin-antitoxin system AbiEi family antitoxin domain-containing protein [Proteiniphilum sp.]|jgi:predicted transcriptional regulator of viral defense system|nr:abortive phage infection protein [Spirochaetales bacterium]